MTNTTIATSSNPSPNTTNDHSVLRILSVRNEKFCPKKPVRKVRGRKIVDLGPLVERPGVFDRQWMQAELGCDPLQLLVGRSLEVQPEEPALLDVLRQILMVGVDQERNRQSIVRSGTRGHRPGAI